MGHLNVYLWEVGEGGYPKIPKYIRQVQKAQKYRARLTWERFPALMSASKKYRAL